MAVKRTDMNFYFGQDYFDLEHDVYPGSGSRTNTDVMLVQFLIWDFFEVNVMYSKLSIGETWAWNDLARSYGNDGSRFCDGAYGSDTRKAVGMFEHSTAAPYKDGIVRAICDPRVVFKDIIDYGSATKLEKLNWNLQQNHSGDKNDIRNAMTESCPPLAARMYGS